MKPPDRTVEVDGNVFWMEVDGPSGGYIVGAPLDVIRCAPDMDATFELDPRAFPVEGDYEKFREAIRFLTTYRRC